MDERKTESTHYVVSFKRHPTLFNACIAFGFGDLRGLSRFSIHTPPSSMSPPVLSAPVAARGAWSLEPGGPGLWVLGRSSETGAGSIFFARPLPVGDKQ